MNPSPITTHEQSAEEICLGYAMENAARAVLKPGDEPQAFFERLVQRELYVDAIEFAARWLTRDAAIWWGCLCAWDWYKRKPSATAANAVQAAVQFVLEPNEDNRRHCYETGHKAGAKLPAGAVALAAFWSTGSMSLPDCPDVAPPADICPLMIASAVKIAAAEAVDRPAALQRRQYLRLALEVVAGKSHWTPPEEVASA